MELQVKQHTDVPVINPPGGAAICQPGPWRVSPLVDSPEAGAGQYVALPGHHGTGATDRHAEHPGCRDLAAV
jgi:hypothetical protein